MAFFGEDDEKPLNPSGDFQSLGESPTHMLHVWYIYLQNWLIYGVNVGKYSIHGAYGQVKNKVVLILSHGRTWINGRRVPSFSRPTLMSCFDVSLGAQQKPLAPWMKSSNSLVFDGGYE
jgi:hypothetical protein